MSTGLVAEVGPASTFSQLLRRSRFAAFDPRIRQTYLSPSEHAHRGDWGLKRPIALRRKNAFITMGAEFDHHANFAEWNSGEGPVRFVRRIDEMNAVVEPDQSGSHGARLGLTQDFDTSAAIGGGLVQRPPEMSIGLKNTFFVSDSEFCRESLDPRFIYERTEVVIDPNNLSEDLPQFGKRGKGAYGAKRNLTTVNPTVLASEDPSKVQIQPNVEAMTRKQLEAYLRHLRSLRPKFLRFLQKKAADDKSMSNEHSEPYVITQDPNKAFRLQKQFLFEATSEAFNAEDYATKGDGRPRIKEQLHRNGGLNYARPTALQIHFGTRNPDSQYQKGHLLHVAPEQRPSGLHRLSKQGENRHTASVAGLLGTVKIPDNWERKHNRRVLMSLYDPEIGSRGGGISTNPEDNNAAEGEMRIHVNEKTQARTLFLHKTPTIVGKYDRAYRNYGLGSVHLRAEFDLLDQKPGEHGRRLFDEKDTYWPGTRAYVRGHEVARPINLSTPGSVPGVVQRPLARNAYAQKETLNRLSATPKQGMGNAAASARPGQTPLDRKQINAALSKLERMVNTDQQNSPKSSRRDNLDGRRDDL